MSGDIVNLRQARKTRARGEKERRAAENRALHGRTKAERQRDEAALGKLSRHVAGHKLTSDEPSGTPD
ncbi:MAG: hypothetical protein CMN87_18115 [Stappia sp.]|uniref:DUF4169 family protein n=1 Tax=Stappia sp. TaxID=1870903 RepID=UPI000C4CE472|nr:DUF4169 family protein [Stappia sp.]MAA97389.1 hypothetical protein [Stappia sp.]MBM21922.1 hypothetical protein [Stappia sp.]|tara:strand:- start:371 stop:574 length:204 start_codon:yes stop_codon:yes gene_type:complete